MLLQQRVRRGCAVTPPVRINAVLRRPLSLVAELPLLTVRRYLSVCLTNIIASIERLPP